jgi:signal transduction histidine kinase
VRRRILLAMVSIALVTVVVLGVPLAVFGRMAVRGDAAVRADKEADAIGLALADRLDAGAALPPGFLERVVAGGRYLVITDRAGTVTTAGTRPADDTTVAAIAGAGGSRIRLYVPDGDVDRRERLLLVTVGGLAVAAVAAAVGIGVVLSRRLARPLDTLAATARRLGEGDFAARTHPTGVAEVDAVGATLDDGARRIGRLVTAEREFSANASHQLRTPLTAVRMRLEEIETLGDADVRSEATAALAQVDRLDTTITDLLRLARDGNAGPTLPLDLEHLARSHAARWDPLARRQHRHVVVDAAGPAWAQASVGAAGHALDILLDNALRHGAGTVTLSVRNHDDVSTIDISDQGPGIPVGLEAMIFHRGVTADGAGIGLALAGDLVNAEHGRLTLVGSQPARFRITYSTPPDGVYRTTTGRPSASPVEPRARRSRSRTGSRGRRIFTES